MCDDRKTVLQAMNPGYWLYLRMATDAFEKYCLFFKFSHNGKVRINVGDITHGQKFNSQSDFWGWVTKWEI
jgi:hypothetical protein